MTEEAEAAAKTVELNEKTLIGKTRFQKTVYFLEELGVGFGFSYEYHYYGPYSEELNTAMEDAEVLGMVSVERKSTIAGTKYSIFHSSNSFPIEKQDDRRRAILKTLARYDALCIELAATADYLNKNGYSKDPWLETKNRKPDKASEERLEKAKGILSELYGLK